MKKTIATILSLTALFSTSLLLAENRLEFGFGFGANDHKSYFTDATQKEIDSYKGEYSPMGPVVVKDGYLSLSKPIKSRSYLLFSTIGLDDDRCLLRFEAKNESNSFDGKSNTGWSYFSGTAQLNILEELMANERKTYNRQRENSHFSFAIKGGAKFSPYYENKNLLTLGEGRTSEGIAGLEIEKILFSDVLELAEEFQANIGSGYSFFDNKISTNLNLGKYVRLSLGYQYINRYIYDSKEEANILEVAYEDQLPKYLAKVGHIAYGKVSLFVPQDLLYDKWGGNLLFDLWFARSIAGVNHEESGQFYVGLRVLF